MAALASKAEEEVISVWPENWQAFELFTRLQTQWQVGMAGPTGLRYEAAYPLIDRIAQDDKQWDELLEDLRTMEIAALNQMAQDRAD
jgi:IS5 family transposase